MRATLDMQGPYPKSAGAGSRQHQQQPFQHLQPLNHSNLSVHTTATALHQHVLGQPLRAHPGQPLRVCGKRSRSNSDASPSSASSPSSHASVFSFENEHGGSVYDSQTSVEHSPLSLSRKTSSGESQHQLDGLSEWRASLSELDVARVCKKLKAVQGAQVIALPAPAPAPVTVVVQQSSPSSSDAGNAESVAAIAGFATWQQSSKEVLAATSAPAPAVVTTAGRSDDGILSSIPSSTASVDDKTVFVDNLVDAAVRTLDAIWNASVTSTTTTCDLGEQQGGLPLHIFVRETLRRARTSCSTLQAAMLYCVRLKDAIAKVKAVEEAAKARETARMLNCPRKMFLSAIMIASKFVQDRTYSNRAWCKITGLPVKELGKIERGFLAAIDYRLVVGKSEWEEWIAGLMQPTTASLGADGARRSSFARSVSDSVTGAAPPLDTELRAASPQTASQLHPKYRFVGVAAVTEMPLPYPMQLHASASQP